MRKLGSGQSLQDPDTAAQVAETVTARIEMLGVSKSFPGVPALDHVDFSVEPGEVHALMGENGAGKSTLIKIMTGAVGRDEGEIRIDGQPVAFASPGEARASGVGAAYQEVNLIPTMSVTENLTLGRQPRRFGLVSWRVARAVARERLERLKIDVDVEQQLGSYSLAVQQLIAIACALEDDTRVLVLDEPTASLDANEVEVLFKIVRDLKAHGIAIVFITHFLDQVYQIADRISVLRNGRLVGTATAAELPRLKLISMMLGRELEETEERLEASPHGDTDEPILVAEGLGRRRVMAPFDLSLKTGEVVGLAGLLGSGRTEVAKFVFGAIKPDSGRLEVASAPVGAHSPGQSMRRGMAFCPEGRKAEGIFAELTVRENIVLGLQTKQGVARSALPRRAGSLGGRNDRGAGDCDAERREAGWPIVRRQTAEGRAGDGLAVRPVERVSGRRSGHPADHRHPDPDGVGARHWPYDQPSLRRRQSELHEPAAAGLERRPCRAHSDAPDSRRGDLRRVVAAALAHRARPVPRIGRRQFRRGGSRRDQCAADQILGLSMSTRLAATGSRRR